MKNILIIAVLFSLTACAHNNYGVSRYSLTVDQDANGNTAIKSIDIETGREAEDLEVLYQRNDDGALLYLTTKKVSAFEGQAIGADVSQSIIESVRETLPKIVDDAVKSSLGNKAIEGAGFLLAPKIRNPPQ